MAYRQKQTEKEHAFQTIAKDLKEEMTACAIALFGKEQYLVNWSCEQIIEKYINPSCKELDLSILEGDRITIDSIKEACETFAMMSEKRIVIVRDFSLLEGGKMKGFSENDEAQLVDYIKQIPEGCLLVVTAAGADKRKKLYKAVADLGSVYDFEPLNDKALKAFIEKRFKAAGKTAKPSIINEFVRNSGYFHKDSDYTLYNLENDIRKITAHSDGEEIMPSDVLSTVAGSLESSVFAMLDAISVGRKDDAYVLLHSLLGAGESVYMVISMIVSQFETILEAKEMIEEGKSQSQIQGILKIHEFRIKKAMSFSGKYSIANLKKILVKAYEIDRSIKTGELDQNLALELFIAQI